MNNRLLAYLDFFIFLIMPLLLIIDMITGFFLGKGVHLPVSQITKLILLFMLLLRIVMSRINRNIAVAVLFFLAYSIFLILYMLSFAPQAVQTIILYSKFIISVFVYIYYYILFKGNPKKTLKQIHTIVIVSTVTMVVNILVLKILNIGSPMYLEGDGIGSKGLFYAGNEISALWIILFAYCMFHIFREKKRYKYIMAIILFLVSFNLGTKTGLAGSVLFSVLFLPRLGENHLTLTKKISRVFLLGIVTITIFGSAFYFIKNSGMLERIAWFYQKYGLVTMILSNRDIYTAEKFTWFSVAPLYMKCFGLGRNLTVEMDFFDTLFNFGYLGVMIVYTFYIVLWLKACVYAKAVFFPFAKWSKYVLILTLSISFFAGHVMFSGMAGPFIGIVTALIFYKPVSNLTNRAVS